MSVEIVTKEDLNVFRLQLLNDLQMLLNFEPSAKKEWLRSSEVRKMLKISPGTLQTLRVSGKLKASKVGGILFYKISDIEELLASGILK